MKNYYSVNKQEDEDGYTLYPSNAIINENSKTEKGITTFNTTDTEHGSENLEYYRMSRSSSVIEFSHAKE